jgi:predicted metal-dependent phosphoesterase TrpH
VNASLTIDLHTHSTCSDGALTPSELVTQAAAAGVHVLALTDHDSTDGLESAQRAADAVSLQLVPGVEISTTWRAQDIHVLGLWIDARAAPLRALLESQAGLRRERMRSICLRLGKARLPGEALLAAVQAKGGLPTRTHLAGAMVALGLAGRADEAFRKYLANGKAGHVPNQWPALQTAIEAIRGAGGIAVLAHPVRYRLSGGARRRLLEEFTGAGGGGLEIMSGGNGAQHVETCTALALKYGLAGSVGSDFHTPQFAWNPLGRSLKLPDCITPVWRGQLP